MIPATHNGVIGDGHPYVRVGDDADGDSARPLLVVPGIDDPFHPMPPPRIGRVVLSWYYLRPFARERPVWLVGRPRGLPHGQTIEEMATGYASVVEAVGGPVDVVGLSMGGFVAQELTRRYPDQVERLVLAASGPRLGPEGREVVSRWRAWAVEGDWGRVYRDSVAEVYDWPRREVYPWLLPVLGLVDAPAHVSDVAVSCRACLEFDGTDRLPDVRAPTLVVGGGDDPFFPGSVLEAAADEIPDARLRIFEREGHGVYEERKGDFDAVVTSFLDG